MAQHSMKMHVIASVRPWLSSGNVVQLEDRSERVAPLSEDEAPIEIEFVGLNEDEQLAALAAFPGGRRFVLKPNRH